MGGLGHSVDVFIERHDLMRAGEAVLVALSGGVDSTVLAGLLLERGHPLTAVHVNFRLREEASDADEAFVRHWCNERNVPLVVRSFDTKRLADERGESVQQAARNLRYNVFGEVAAECGCARIALGHHRDDQAETLLLNLFRGTGPEGLAGMPVRRRVYAGSEIDIVRPLLGSRRRAIENHAREHAIEWREDASNIDPSYRRGALRTTVLPLLEQQFGEAVVENIARSADLVQGYLDATLDPKLEGLFSAILHQDSSGGAVNLRDFETLPAVLRRRVVIEAMRRWMPGIEADARTAEAIDALRSSQVGRRLEYRAGTVWRERDRLFFQGSNVHAVNAPRAGDRAADHRLDDGASVDIARGVLRAERLPLPPKDVRSYASHDVYLDARAVSFPLTVRTWRAGDRFTPLGMDGTKKLSDFLTDESVPPHRREDVLVVESEGEIVWVVPMRIAHGARIRDDSVETVHLSYVPRENTREPEP